MFPCTTWKVSHVVPFTTSYSCDTSLLTDAKDVKEEKALISIESYKDFDQIPHFILYSLC